MHLISIPQAIIIVGAGRLAKACAELAFQTSLSLECIEPDDTGFPVLQNYCERKSIKYSRVLNRKELDRKLLQITEPTLVVSAYNIHLFSPEVIANQKLSIINFHNSLLPRHRGRNSPTWSIYEMDPVTGVTWHLITSQIDKGTILYMNSFNLEDEMRALDVVKKTLEEGADGFKALLPQILCGKINPKIIQHNLTETFHLSNEVPNKGMLDLNWSIKKMDAFLRSVDYVSYRVFDAPKVKFQEGVYDILSYNRQSSLKKKTELEALNLIIDDGEFRLTLNLGVPP
jgi:methionyl-tRNA formyltransferase